MARRRPATERGFAAQFLALDRPKRRSTAPSSLPSSPNSTAIHEGPIVARKLISNRKARRAAPSPLRCCASSRLAVLRAEPPLPPPIVSQGARVLPVLASHGMVVAQEGTAAKIGVDILRRGGNAVDAAVAIGLALAVTLPRAGNLGGGGFMLIHLAKAKKTIVIDYREAAPADTPRDVFLNEAGRGGGRRARATAALPSACREPSRALRSRCATMGRANSRSPNLPRPPWRLPAPASPSRTISPIRFPWCRAACNAGLRRRGFFCIRTKAPLARGDRLVQTDLAGVLEAIGRDGERAFYEGAGCRKNRRERPRGGRPDDAGRSQILSRG